MSPKDYRKIATAFRTLGDLFEQMADEAGPAPGEQLYINRVGAARMCGCSRETIRQRILDGTLNEYPAGILISELEAWASGKTTPKSQTYRVESPRAKAARRLNQ